MWREAVFFYGFLKFKKLAPLLLNKKLKKCQIKIVRGNYLKWVIGLLFLT